MGLTSMPANTSSVAAIASLNASRPSIIGRDTPRRRSTIAMSSVVSVSAVGIAGPAEAVPAHHRAGGRVVRRTRFEVGAPFVQQGEGVGASVEREELEAGAGAEAGHTQRVPLVRVAVDGVATGHDAAERRRAQTPHLGHDAHRVRHHRHEAAHPAPDEAVAVRRLEAERLMIDGDEIGIEERHHRVPVATVHRVDDVERDQLGVRGLARRPVPGVEVDERPRQVDLVVRLDVHGSARRRRDAPRRSARALEALA